MAVNVDQPVVTIAPGHSGSVTLDAQRMTDGPDGYAVTGTSSDGGIGVQPASGRFAADGSAAVTVPITVAQSVPEDYYLVSLTTTVGHTVRTSTVLVVAQAESDN
ncbi:hypothetical protein MUNTM_11440 [Mycobacterium sp. MUNTM1]